MQRLIQFALRRPKLVIAGWIAIIALAAPFSMRLAGALRGSTDTVPGSPSELVSRDVNHAFGTGSAFVLPAVLVSRDLLTTDPRFAQAAAKLARALDSSGMVGVRHYWNTGDPALLGRDGHTALLLFAVPNKAANRFSPVRVKLTTRLPGVESRAAHFSSVKRLIKAAPSVPAR
jgi:uncharacterized membrane protein YdfJ with MMPL/SSD domain